MHPELKSIRTVMLGASLLIATLPLVRTEAQIPTLVPTTDVLESPHRFSGFLVSNYPTTAGVGSGVMAVHPKFVITAAHVVFDGVRKHLPPLSNINIGYPNPMEIRWFPARHRAWNSEPLDFESGALLRSPEIATNYASLAFDFYMKKSQLDQTTPYTVDSVIAKSWAVEANAKQFDSDFCVFWSYENVAPNFADHYGRLPKESASDAIKDGATSKLLTGYPDIDAHVAVDNDPNNIGLGFLFQTSIGLMGFQPDKTAAGYTTSVLYPNSPLIAYGGNSGGPLWVKNSGDTWKLGGIVLDDAFGIHPLDSPNAKMVFAAANKKVVSKPDTGHPTVNESTLGYKIGPGWSEVYGLGETFADQDVFELSIASDGYFQIETSEASPSPSLDTVGTLTKLSGSGFKGTKVDDDSGDGKNFRFSVYLTKGKYKLVVRGAYPTLRGQYRLGVSALPGNGTQQIEVVGAGKTTPIKNYSSVSQASAALGTHFGSITGAVPTVPSKTLTFNIRNTGGGVLALTGTPKVAISGLHASQFQVVSQPAEDVIPARVGTTIRYTTFSIRYLPTIVGNHIAKVAIQSDSIDDTLFQFAIRGSAPNLPGRPIGDISHLVSASLDVTGWESSQSQSSSALDYGGDIDMFRFVLTERKLCTFWTTGDADTFGTLYQLASKQTKLLSADAGGDNRNFSLTRVLDPGTYIVEVKGANADVVGDYTLHATQTAVSGYAVVTNAKGIPIADGTVLADKTLGTDFGSVDYRKGTVEQTYTITNQGFADISLIGNPKVALTASGGSPHFTIKTQPSATVLKPGAKSTFVVRYDPEFEGTFDSLIVIPTTGSGMTDGGLYTFAIQGRASGRVQPLQMSRRLATSNRSSYFFDPRGGVKVWGEIVTMFGNLISPTPASTVFKLSQAPTSVAGGFNRFQITMPDGNVLGWGAYSQVSLGYGEDLGEYEDLWEESPQAATRSWGADEAVQVVVGASHTVVLTGSGEVWSWGSQRFGELGNGSVVAYSPNKNHIKKTPQNITSKFGGAKIIQIAAGAFHTLALDSNGTVWTWGYGGDGQLGLGAKTNKSVPTKLSPTTFGSSRVVSVACAFDASYAVTEAGVVWSWGFNGRGALGDGTVTSRTTPVMVRDVSSGRAHDFGGGQIKQLAAGSDQIFVLTEDGSVWTWGEAVQLETDMSDPMSITDEELQSWTSVWTSPHLLVSGSADPFPSIIEMVAKGQQGYYGSSNFVLSLTHALFLRSDGSVWACGANSNGQLGDGTFMSRTAPVEVIAAPPFVAAGEIDTSYAPSVSGGIYGMAVQPDGKTIIGGAFTSISEHDRNHLARITPGGEVDPDFNPDVNANVLCVAIQPDGKILIGGSFTQVGGTTAPRIARLNTDGSRDGTFHVNLDGTVNCLALQPDGKILLGGQFSSDGTSSCNRLLRLNANGSRDSSFTSGLGTVAGSVSTTVRSIALQPDGKVLIIGDFLEVGSTGRNSFARLNPDGSVDLSFAGNSDVTPSYIRSMALQPDGQVVVGGNFTSINGIARNRVARFKADGTLDAGFNPSLNGFTLYSIIAQADGKMMLLGDFTSVGDSPRPHAVRIHPDGSLDTTFVLIPDSTALSGAFQADGKLLLGGGFANSLSRLTNDLSSMTLKVSGTRRIQWFQSGSAPGLHQVTFELSSNKGQTWTMLGTGRRISSGWELDHLNLPASGKIRARARTCGGYQNGSSGLIEAVTTYFQ
jgi:uncharacterized delta-60 repeat protein